MIMQLLAESLELNCKIRPKNRVKRGDKANIFKSINRFTTGIGFFVNAFKSFC